jgi:murein DD-endopeptidase MepM/ murein hydrolase activator NlpD
MGRGKGRVVWPTTSKSLSGNYGGHSGLDVRVSYKPVWSSADARVEYTGTGKGYGKAMMIRTMGVTIIHGHLSKTTKRAGNSLKKGERFGTTGNTGHSTGPHLHLEVASSIGARGRSSNRNKTFAWYRNHGVKLAEGGIVSPIAGGVLATIAEGGRPERVEPLDRQGMSERDRAIIRAVVEQLAARQDNTNRSYGTPSILVRVYIGDTELRDIVGYEVEANNENLSNMIRVGRRSG